MPHHTSQPIFESADLFLDRPCLSFCWAEIAEAKLIAEPTKASGKRIFIASSGEFRTACQTQIKILLIARGVVVGDGGSSFFAESSKGERKSRVTRGGAVNWYLG